MYVSGAWVRPPSSDAASTVIAPAWPWATRFVPSSGSTAMSTAGASARALPVSPTRSPMYSIGASSRSPSPMTIRPANSISSMVRRIASVAAASASSFSPRPMNRAESMAAASVTRTISRARSCSTAYAWSVSRWPQGVASTGASAPTCVSGAHGHAASVGSADRQCRKCRRPVKTIARWWRSATSMAISSRIEPPGWMIAVTPADAAAAIPSGNGK